jgi:beta-lactamase class A
MAALLLLAVSRLQAANTGDLAAALEKQLAEIASSCGGKVGVSALHIESGTHVGLHGSDRFPMASAYKVAIAFQLLSLVDQRKESLDRAIVIHPADIHPEGGPLTQRFNQGVRSFSICELLEMMLIESDNSKADIVLTIAGGPNAVTASMRALGIHELRVDRSTIQMIFDMYGLPLPPKANWGPGRYVPLIASVAPDQASAARMPFAQDPRDTSTPEAMLSLLVHIYRHDGLKPESSALLMDIMRRCATGTRRLRAELPPTAEIADKAGTGPAGITNDVGIIMLPGDRGHLAVVVFVSEWDAPLASRERAIARMGRVLWDYFLSNHSSRDN